MPRNSTALLLIRAWLERGSSKPLRVHIRISNDVADGFQSELTLVEAADVCSAVEMWLEGVVESGKIA